MSSALSQLGADLLTELGVAVRAEADDPVPLVAWAASGGMALTGPRGGPPDPGPAAVAAHMEALGGALAHVSCRVGRRVTVDGSQLVGERAAFAGMDRRGSTSVGGLARMVRAADGWMALNLARPSDVEALPALVAAPVDPGDWSEIAARISALPVAELVETGQLLGLPVAAVTEVRSPAPEHPWRVLSYGADISPRDEPLVVDLTGLWAGPLAGSLIGAAGARVVKVESRSRPDGARFGPAGFFDLLNAEKEMVAFHPGDPVELRRLRRLLGAADLVLEGSRPRVMDQWGVDPEALVADGTSWISITGHGRCGPDSNRVAFGDDAAVAGGLVIPGSPPRFVADAIADPIAGLVAALVGSAALIGEKAVMVDVSLRQAAAWAGGDGDAESASMEHRDGRWYAHGDAGECLVVDPRARPVTGGTSRSGADTDSVMARLRL